MFQHNPDEFLRRFITCGRNMDPLLHIRDEGTVKQWTSPGEPTPKNAKTVKSVGKMMATVFWDARGIIHINYLSSKQTINGDYAALLDRFNILKKKRPHLMKKKILFHQDTGSHRWPNSTNSATNCFLSIFAKFSPLVTISYFQI